MLVLKKLVIDLRKIDSVPFYFCMTRCDKTLRDSSNSILKRNVYIVLYLAVLTTVCLVPLLPFVLLVPLLVLARLPRSVPSVSLNPSKVRCKQFKVRVKLCFCLCFYIIWWSESCWLWISFFNLSTRFHPVGKCEIIQRCQFFENTSFPKVWKIFCFVLFLSCWK